MWILRNSAKIRQKFLYFSVFRGCLLTSSRCKKFSMALINMFLASKSFSRIRGTQRTSNHVRATHRKKTARFEAVNCGFLRNSVKIRQEMSIFQRFQRCLPPLRRSKKFSMALTKMFWVCKSFSKIRGTQRTLNQERTTRRKKTARFEAKKC